jgi:hypothetical protein
MTNTQGFHPLARLWIPVQCHSRILFHAFEIRSVGQGALPEITNSVALALIDVMMWRITP